MVGGRAPSGGERPSRGQPAHNKGGCHMARFHPLRSLRLALLSGLLALVASLTPALAADVTTPFMGKTVNGGTVTHEKQGGKHVLTVSSDFRVPDSPDPHWRGVDSQGDTFLLHPLKLKGDKIHPSITLPPPIQDVATVPKC